MKGRIDENERQRNDLVQANTDLKSENKKLQNQVKELEGMPFNKVLLCNKIFTCFLLSPLLETLGYLVWGLLGIVG